MRTWVIAGVGQHGHDLRRHAFFGSGRREQVGRQPLARCIRSDIVERRAGQHRCVLRQQRVDAGEPVLVLDQQPLLVRGGAHQRERTFQFFAAQEDAEFAVRQLPPQSFFGFLAIAERILTAFVRRIDAAVPDDHIAGAVLFLRNHAFERRIVERVILDFHREPLLAHLQRRALGNGPGFQNAIEFEPEIVVQPPSRMFLHDEQQRPAALTTFGPGSGVLVNLRLAA